MPRPPKRAQARSGLTLQEKRLMTSGVSLMTRFGAVHKDLGDIEGLRATWALYRDELMDQWISENPFSRPWCWLKFDASEPRLRTIGEQRMESQQAAANGKRRDYRLCFFENLNSRLGAEDTRGHEGDWETERQYLSRIGALTEWELSLL